MPNSIITTMLNPSFLLIIESNFFYKILHWKGSISREKFNKNKVCFQNKVRRKNRVGEIAVKGVN